ncbi:MAG: hypothetical protein H7835_00985 [Magnetococcus sp. XQGC-1]
MRERTTLEQVKHCFSLVEVAIALILFGLVVAATMAGEEAARKAEIRAAYQSVVVPCVAAIGEAMRRGASEASAAYPAVRLDGTLLTCSFTASAGRVIDRVAIAGAPQELQTLIQQSLSGDATLRVEGATITLVMPPSPISASADR